VFDVIKAHAYGNDFLFIPDEQAGGRDRSALARAACARHTGVGADGLVFYRLTQTGASMTLFNADGSPAEVSGNAVRCLAAIVHRGGGDLRRVGDPVGPRLHIVIGTDAGPANVAFVGVEDGRYTFRALMRRPSGIRRLDLDAAGETVPVVALSVGNPQCVVLQGPVTEARLHKLGPALSTHAAFPGGTNVSFVEVETPHRLRILVWERGVGPTSSSGTGACGAAVAAAAHGGAARDVEVVSPGGSQHVEWTDEGIYLTGWAEVTLEGRWCA
jgi:diaminopimelate epimerase